MAKTEKKTITFLESKAEQIYHNVFYNEDGGVVAIFGPAESGKTHLCKTLLAEAKRHQAQILSLPLETVIKSHFILQDFSKALFAILQPFFKELKLQINYDFSDIKNIFKTKFNEHNENEKEKSRKTLIDFLFFVDAFIKEFNIKIIVVYDEIDSLPKHLLLKILQLARYIKNYIPNVNLFLFFNEQRILNTLNAITFEDFKKEYFNSMISTKKSWEFYELENKMIYQFIIRNEISSISQVIYLLSHNQAYAFLSRGFKGKYDVSTFIHLVTEIEFLGFALAYLKLADNASFLEVVNSVTAFFLIKEVPGYIAIEQRSPENKKMFSKIKSLISFFATKETQYDAPNKYAFITSNISFPYDYEWQILFCAAHDEQHIKEENLNCYVPMFLTQSKIQFWEKKNQEYWFCFDDTVMPSVLKKIYHLILEHNIYFAIPSVMEQIFYYDGITEFLIFFVKVAHQRRN